MSHSQIYIHSQDLVCTIFAKVCAFVFWSNHCRPFVWVCVTN